MKRWQMMCYFRILLCLVLVAGIIHPLRATVVQADDNKSVLDSVLSNQDEDDEGNSLEQEELGGTSEEESIIGGDEWLPEQNLFGMFLQLFFALAFVIFLIYVLIRFIGKRSQSYHSNRTLQNIGGVHVGSNRSIQLVRVGERILVVGVGETIQLLKEISDEEEVSNILSDYQIQEGQQQFSSLVGWFRNRLYGQAENPNSELQFKGLLERQLQDVKSSQKQAHAQIKERER